MLWIIEELKRFGEIKPEAIEGILESIRERHPEIFKSLVRSAYVDGRISLGKAAELIGVTRMELEKEFREKGVPIRVISEKDVKAEVEAMRTWK